MTASRLALSALCATFLAASAPQLHPQETGFGLRSGTAIGGLGGTDGVDARPGFTLGPTFALPVSSWLAVQAELLYSKYGSRWSETDVGPSFAPGLGSASFQQVQAPVLARVNVGELIDSPIMLSVYAGPHASYLLSCRLDRTVPCGALDDTSPFAHVSGFAIGGTAGMGLAVDFFDAIQVAADVRYQQGLRNIALFEQGFRNRAWIFTFRLAGTGHGVPAQPYVDALQPPIGPVPGFPVWPRRTKGVRM